MIKTLTRKIEEKIKYTICFQMPLFLETFFIIIPVKIGHLSIIKLIDCLLVYCPNVQY